MKKLQAIPEATGNADPGEAADLWEKDQLIRRLQKEGHRTISVGRAVLTIEQCEPGDDFPPGWSNEPLQITVYSDPDSGVSTRDVVYLHAGRSGLMDIIVRRAGSESHKMAPLPIDAVNAAAESDFAQVGAIRNLANDYLCGFYQTHRRNQVIDKRPDGSEVKVEECIEMEFDQKLAELGANVVKAIEHYLARLREIPDVFENWENRGG